MRIVLLTAGVRGIGTYCLNLYRKLTALGHEVLLISERKWEKQPIESFYQARSFMLFGMAPLVYRPGQVAKAIESFRPDLIHHHWPCGTMDLFFGLVARLRIPYIVTIHTSIASKQHILDRFWYLLFTIYRRWMRGAVAVNCISDFVRLQLASRITLPPERIHRIYAGIDEKLFTPPVAGAPALQASSGIRLIFVGQIMPEKGIDVLVRAVIEVHRSRDDIELTIVGQGPLEIKLRRLSQGDPKIHWTGFLKGQAEIAAYYRSSDATVLPTRWDEAFSLVPIESFACGTPVLATARGGTPEAVVDGVTGYLIGEPTVEELTRVLLSLDKTRLSSMREACRALVLERHTLEMMGERHVALYREALEA